MGSLTNWVRAGLLLVLASCTHVPIIDGSMSSLMANDTTAIIQIDGPGCVSDPKVGWAYCRKAEGAITNRDVITFYGPKSNCSREFCVDIQVMWPTGEPALHISIPADQLSVSTSWDRLTKKELFDKNDRGWWLVFINHYWLDGSGVEQETVQEGEIRLRVMAEGYTPLYNAPTSGAFAYVAERNGHEFKWTTSGRAYTK